MKKITSIFLAMILSVFAFNCYAQSSSGLADERFAKADQWLHQKNLSITKSTSQAFVDSHIVVEGEGLPSREAMTTGQKRLTAIRAAEVVAYRRLAEFLEGVGIAGDSTTKDLTLKYDTVRITVTGFVKGAQVIYREYNEKDETALVLLKVGVTGPAGYGEAIYTKVMKDPKVRDEIEDKTVKPFVVPQPAVLEASYDGLIIDATEHNFRPALINRVFTVKGEALYDPSKVQEKILVEHGCGDYTNNVEKAKSALKSRGVQNPLLVKASGTLSPSDLKVSDDDAVRIFTANQKTNFLNSAKVAFVLK